MMDMTLRQILIDIKLNLTTVYERIFDIVQEYVDKTKFYELLEHLYELDIKFIETLVRIDSERIEMFIGIINKRTDEYEKLLQSKTLFGFVKKAALRIEARKQATDEVIKLLFTTSITNNPAIKQILDQRLIIREELRLELKRLTRDNLTFDDSKIHEAFKMIPG